VAKSTKSKTTKAKAAEKPKAKAKKMAGRSNIEASPVIFKPAIYLEDGQIPASLKGTKVGANVNLTVTGKIVRKSETQDKGGTNTSVAIEIGEIKSTGKKKPG
jgi:hypothetical protein